MSRSYKKHPIITDHSKITRYKKREASKKVRRTKDIAKGNTYRKIYDPWNICDYKLRTTWKEELHITESKLGRPLTEKEKQELKKQWTKYYRRK